MPNIVYRHSTMVLPDAKYRLSTSDHGPGVAAAAMAPRHSCASAGRPGHHCLARAIGATEPPNEVDRAVLLKLGVPNTAIETFGEANKNTRDEAVALREWAERNNASALIVPSEVFSARRVRWILRREFAGTAVRRSGSPNSRSDAEAQLRDVRVGFASQRNGPKHSRWVDRLMETRHDPQCARSTAPEPLAGAGAGLRWRCQSASKFLMTDCKPFSQAGSDPRDDRADVAYGAGTEGAGAEVRAPAHLRRLSSFSSADWVPHAKCASWGCLGLTRGDRHCRSQNWWRIPRTGANALAAASDIAVRIRKQRAAR
jgi:hypothetical protein